MLQDRLELSERRACRVTGQHRSTQRRLPARGRGDDALQDGVTRLLAWPPPLGLPPGLGDLARGGMEREPQAGATALA